MNKDKHDHVQMLQNLWVSVEARRGPQEPLRFLTTTIVRGPQEALRTTILDEVIITTELFATKIAALKIFLFKQF